MIRFSAHFWAGWRRRRISATLLPSSRHKYGSAANARVIERLPESS
jgi:hypothetical protein